MEEALNQAPPDAQSAPDGQAGTEPNAPAGASAEPAPVTLDPAILKQIEEVAPGMTPEGLVKSYRESRAALGKTQNELNQLKQQYEPFTPVLDKINSDPEYAATLARASEEYLGGSGSGAAGNTNAAFDPIANRLRELETRIAQQDMGRSIEALQQKYPQDVDEAVVAAINNRVIQTGDGNVEGHFWALMGETLVERAKARAQEAAVKEVVQNNERFPASADIQPGAPAVPDISQMSEADQLREFAQILEGEG